MFQREGTVVSQVSPEIRQRFIDQYVRDLRRHIAELSGCSPTIRAVSYQDMTIVTLKPSGDFGFQDNLPYDKSMIIESHPMGLPIYYSASRGVSIGSPRQVYIRAMVQIRFPSESWENLNAYWTNVQAWLFAKEICKIIKEGWEV